MLELKCIMGEGVSFVFCSVCSVLIKGNVSMELVGILCCHLIIVHHHIIHFNALQFVDQLKLN